VPSEDRAKDAMKGLAKAFLPKAVKFYYQRDSQGAKQQDKSQMAIVFQDIVIAKWNNQ
jgi:hypothetical protein